ncbi:hypothetical protein ACYF6T_39055 [Streptomyces sp. 7R007]
MTVSLLHPITIADYLTRHGLPADWRFGSPLGRIAAELYRDTYRREPRKAWRLINGHRRQVMAYTPDEEHILAEAWRRYPRTSQPAEERQPRTVLQRIDQALSDWAGSVDSMRWRPTGGPLRSHP